VKSVTSSHGGDWLMRVFADETHGAEHVVLSKGDLSAPGPVMVRVHALNPLEDVLGIGAKGRAACRHALIAAEGRGVVVLLRDTTMKMVAPGEVRPRPCASMGLARRSCRRWGYPRSRW
jgi:3,4-dihydroxy 2-butanone 4-phosphate synthase/GTP cyclohydrolase II